MRPDIKLDSVWMSGLGWLRESISFPTPQSQTNTIVVPGRNSPIRYTEALGRVSYQPRSFEIILSMLGTREQFNQKVSAVVNPFAGHLVKVVCSEEPGLYAIGTLEMSPAYDPLTRKGQLTVSCSDGDSYRYHVNETVVTVTAEGMSFWIMIICLWSRSSQPRRKRHWAGRSAQTPSKNLSAPVLGNFLKWNCRPEEM